MTEWIDENFVCNHAAINILNWFLMLKAFRTFFSISLEFQRYKIFVYVLVLLNSTYTQVYIYNSSSYCSIQSISNWPVDKV